MCRTHDRVELWIDPDPNAQLVMVQLLDWLGTLPDSVPRRWRKQSAGQLGGRQAGDWVLPPRRVEAADLVLARRAWSAFGAATPEAWCDLRADPDLGRRPSHRLMMRTGGRAGARTRGWCPRCGDRPDRLRSTRASQAFHRRGTFMDQITGMDQVTGPAPAVTPVAPARGWR